MFLHSDFLILCLHEISNPAMIVFHIVQVELPMLSKTALFWGVYAKHLHISSIKKVLDARLNSVSDEGGKHVLIQHCAGAGLLIDLLVQIKL